MPRVEHDENGHFRVLFDVDEVEEMRRPAPPPIPPERPFAVKPKKKVRKRKKPGDRVINHLGPRVTRKGIGIEQAPGKRFKSQVCVGIEIELENFVRNAPRDMALWRAENDPSLKNRGIEFILVEPLAGINLERAFDELREMFGLVKDLDPSCRTSLHIHVDCRNLSVDEYKSVVYTSVMFEDLLFKMFGKGRENNNFCRPTSEVTTPGAMASFADLPEFHTPGRYRATNLESIRKFGSIEYRMFNSTTDVHKIEDMVEAVLCIYSEGLRAAYEDSHFEQKATDVGFYNIAKEVMGARLSRLLPSKAVTTSSIIRGVEASEYAKLADAQIEHYIEVDGDIDSPDGNLYYELNPELNRGE